MRFSCRNMGDGEPQDPGTGEELGRPVLQRPGTTLILLLQRHKGHKEKQMFFLYRSIGMAQYLSGSVLQNYVPRPVCSYINGAFWVHTRIGRIKNRLQRKAGLTCLHPPLSPHRKQCPLFHRLHVLSN